MIGLGGWALVSFTNPLYEVTVSWPENLTRWPPAACTRHALAGERMLTSSCADSGVIRMAIYLLMMMMIGAFRDRSGRSPHPIDI